MNFQRPRQPQKDIHGGHPEATLNLPHIDRVNVNPLGQLFLRQAGQLAEFTDAITQKFSISFCNHDWPISQSGSAQSAQILLAIILRLRYFVKVLENEQNESAGNGVKAGKGGIPGQRIIVAAHRNPFGSLKVLQPNRGCERQAHRQFSPTSPR